MQVSALLGSETFRRIIKSSLSKMANIKATILQDSGFYIN